MAQDQFGFSISNQPDEGSDIEIDQFLKQFDPPQPVQPVGQPPQPPPPPLPVGPGSGASPPPVAPPTAPDPGKQPGMPGSPLATDPLSPWIPGNTARHRQGAPGLHDPASTATGASEHVNPRRARLAAENLPAVRPGDQQLRPAHRGPAKATAATNAAVSSGTAEAARVNPPLLMPSVQAERPPPDMTQIPLNLVKGWLAAGPQKAWEGLKGLHDELQRVAPSGKLGAGNYAKPAGELLSGATMTALPAVAPALVAGAVAAPLVAAGEVAAGIALTGGAEATARRLGASEDQAALIGEIAGNVSPAHFAAALPFVPRRALSKVLGSLPKDVAEGVTKALAKSPHLRPALTWLHPAETAAFGQMKPAAQAEFLKVYAALPDNEFFAAVAQGGLAKLGWYEHSRAAIQHVFGEDADLFAGILAATSPRVDVETNLRNAIHIYQGWVKAGRPTDEAAIIKIMGQKCVRGQGDASVLHSWKNNTVRVLQGGSAISGPKVDSFWRNLRNRDIVTAFEKMRPEDAVTLDAWMSNVLGLQQEHFSGAGDRLLHEGNPGYSPGYLATSSRLREAATKAGMTPEQMQETMWSWGKALYEQSEATRMSAVDIVKQGLLDHAAIEGTPDFGTLFHDPALGDVIRRAGPEMEQRLATLPRGQFGQTPTPTPRELKWQLEAAKVLDELKASRELGSKIRIGENRPGKVGVTIPTEGTPGLSAGAADFFTPDVSEGQRAKFGSQILNTNEDPRGRSIIGKGLGMPTAENQAGIGVYTPPEGATQFNPMRAVELEARRVGDTIHPEDEKAITTAARAIGAFDRQDVVVHSAVVYDTKNKNVIHVVTPNKVRGQTLDDLITMFPSDKYSIQNRGDAIDIGRFDGGQVTPEEAARVQATIQATYNADAAASGKKPVVVPGWALGENIANDQAFTGLPWSDQPGSRQVTKVMLEHYDGLTKAQKTALDSTEVRQMAGEKLDIWKHQAEGVAKKLRKNVPEDFLNALTLVKNGGISALRKALDDPKQLLPLLVMTGLLRPVPAPTKTDTDAAGR